MLIIAERNRASYEKLKFALLPSFPSIKGKKHKVVSTPIEINKEEQFLPQATLCAIIFHLVYKKREVTLRTVCRTKNIKVLRK